MAFLKNDVTDEDLEKLFDKNDNSKFTKKESSDKNELKDIIPQELDIHKEESNAIQRPEYKADEVHKQKINEEKTEKKLLNEESLEKFSNLSGSVSKKLFNELAKLRSDAKLEEYKKTIAKLPVIKPNAKLKLYSDKPQCTYHIYKCIQLLDSNHVMACCKFCSESKTFTLSEWKDYTLKNSKYI